MIKVDTGTSRIWLEPNCYLDLRHPWRTRFGWTAELATRDATQPSSTGGLLPRWRTLPAIVEDLLDLELEHDAVMRGTWSTW